jgi:type IV pilus assembly protein PilW
MTSIHNKPNKPSGMSLVELLVAIGIGSILMVGLVTVFSNSSRSHRELEKASQLIENGRYAVDLLYEDIRHTGYYGHFYDLPAASGLQDPCETASATNLYNGLSMPVQGYTAIDLAGDPSLDFRPDITATTCDDKGLFPTSAPFNTSKGSDILVIRRADTALFSGTSPDGTTTVATGTPTTGEVYIQANMRAADIQIGNSGAGVIDPTDTSAKTADNATQDMEKYPSKTSTTWADIRKYHVHVYFVAPCSIGSGTNGVCTSTDDTIPTLKRLELTNDASGNTIMEIVPLVEGIEYLRLQYGIDTTPTATNPVTNQIGDGVPDSYVSTPSTAQWPSVVAIRASLLARNVKETQGYSDGKVYTLAGVTIPASGTIGDKFKRHVFSTEIRPMNLSGRREIPE